MQDETLRRAVNANGGKNWKKIAESVPNRTDVQCLHRWQKVLNPELVKGPWKKEVRSSAAFYRDMRQFHDIHTLLAGGSEGFGVG